MIGDEVDGTKSDPKPESSQGCCELGGGPARGLGSSSYDRGCSATAVAMDRLVILGVGEIRVDDLLHRAARSGPTFVASPPDGMTRAYWVGH